MTKLTFTALLLMLFVGVQSAFAAQDTSDWITYEVPQPETKAAQPKKAPQPKTKESASGDGEARNNKSTVQTSTSNSQGLFLVGVGSNSDDDDYSSDSTAWSLGYLAPITASGYRWGFDISGEGTLLDSTYNQYQAIDSGFSFNLLVGGDFADNFSAGILVGAIETAQKCARQSYLGFQCYADEDPESSYDFNYGVFGIYRVGSFAFGTRITGESQQLTIGFSF